MGNYGMPITSVTWMMIIALVGTNVLLNLFESKYRNNSEMISDNDCRLNHRSLDK